jgi:hypothetical protein
LQDAVILCLAFMLGFVIESQDKGYTCPNYCETNHIHRVNKIYWNKVQSDVNSSMAKASEIEYNKEAHKQAIDDILNENGAYMADLSKLPFGSEERRAEYDRRDWAYDETIAAPKLPMEKVQEAFTRVFDKTRKGGQKIATNLIETAQDWKQTGDRLVDAITRDDITMRQVLQTSGYDEDFDFEDLIGPGREGGYVHHKHDKGGATKYGVTESEARNFGYKGNMQDLPKDVALDYYKSKWGKEAHSWEGSKLIQNKMFDISVNMGRGGSIKVIQNALNFLGYNVQVDGGWKAGGETDKAYKHALENIGDKALFKEIQRAQKARYEGIIAGDETQQSFQQGWMNRVDFLADKI